MILKRPFFILLVCTLSITVQAQRRPWLLRALDAVKTYIDSSAVKGVDARYITVPERPWQVIARFNMDHMDLNMFTHFEFSDETGSGNLNIDSKLRTGTANRVGLWLGYRGYGIGYSVNVGRQRGSYFTAGVTGGSYGLNLRLRTFSTKEFDVRLYGRFDEDNEMDIHDVANLPEPIRVRTMIIDGYYLLNGRHFSHTAAYDQSNLQLRSAGSVMVGAMWHNTSIKYADNENASFVEMMNDIGELRIRQGSLGIGYAYNWVPAKGFLVNAMFMPMITVYNMQQATIYETNIDMDTYETTNDYITYEETIKRRSNMMVTYNARVSLTYNWDRFFFNVNGQWNHYRYDHDDAGNGKVNDWLLNTSLGIRL